MAKSGVSGYAALSARVRAMHSYMLGAQDMTRLSDSPDFPSLVSQLKQTAYGPYIAKLKEDELTPRHVIIQIKERLADVYSSVIHMAPGQIRPLLIQLFRYFEVDNLKAVLRAIVSGSDWEQVKQVLFPMGPLSVVPVQAMIEAGNVAAAVELLNGTVYEEPLSFAMKRYSQEQNLFPLEVALDLYYWRQLWKQAKQLQGIDREQATRVVGLLMDMNNLTWAVRYRVYYHLSEEELINYTLPFGYHVRDEDVRAVAAGADIASVVSHVYPDIPEINSMLETPQSGLPSLEVHLKRQLMKQCMAAFAGNPFHAGLPLAFLVLSNLEIQDIVVLIEGKSSGMSDDEIRPFLLKEGVAKA